MSEIMPCPHCGKRDPLVDKYQSARVVCLACCTSGPLMPAEADAVRAWNRLAMATSIAEAAWLCRETSMAAQSCRRGSSVNPPGATLERAARGLVQKMDDMLDAWGEDGPE